MSPLTWKLFMSQGLCELSPQEKAVAYNYYRYFAYRDVANRATEHYKLLCKREQGIVVDAVCSFTKTQQELEQLAEEHHQILERERFIALAAENAAYDAWTAVKEAEKELAK